MPPRAVRTAVRTETPRSFAGTGAPLVVSGALLWLAMSVGACADGVAVRQQQPAVAPTEWRVLVKLSPSFDATAPEPAAIAESASRGAGVPAVHLAAAGAAWHALALRCAPADCDAALQRLAADRLHFGGVERDALRRAAR